MMSAAMMRGGDLGLIGPGRALSMLVKRHRDGDETAYCHREDG
jgi:hypothetical protein